jgi:hypothetical protein
MTAITVGTATATIPAKANATKASAAKSNPTQPGLLARAWAAFVEARMRQVEREIAQHRHLLPGQLQTVGERLAPRGEKELPFAR